MAAYFSRTGGAPGYFNPPSGIQHVVASYAASPSDYYIGVSGSGITVTLPSSSLIYSGKTLYIKDESGNSVTVAGNGNLIDGSASVTLNRNYMCLQVMWTGSFWSVI